MLLTFFCDAFLLEHLNSWIVCRLKVLANPHDLRRVKACFQGKTQQLSVFLKFIFPAVILACRNIARGEALKQEIIDSVNDHNAEIEVWKLDVSDFSSVREFVEKWKATGRSLHVLINNAGIFNMSGKKDRLKCIAGK